MHYSTYNSKVTIKRDPWEPRTRYFSVYDRYTFTQCKDISAAFDLQQLVGITQENDNDTIIVTYQGLVQRVELSESEPNRMIQEWRTKCRLTSPVIYDKHHASYVGVFNDDTVRLWTSDTTNIDEQNKYKFRLKILKLLQREAKSSLIVFTNGNCISLEQGFEHCKTYRPRALIKESTKIVDSICYCRHKTDHVCYIVTTKEDENQIIVYPLNDELSDCNYKKMHTETVMSRWCKRTKLKVVGKIIVPFDNPQVYILWSDRKTSIYDTVKNSWKLEYRQDFVSYESDIIMTYIGRKFFFMCAPTKVDTTMVKVCHFEDINYQKDYLKVNHWEQAKLYSFNEFVVLVEEKQILLFHMKFHDLSLRRRKYPDGLFELQTFSRAKIVKYYKSVYDEQTANYLLSMRF